MYCYFQASSEDSLFKIFLSQLCNLLFILYYFCIARPIRFVVSLALNIYDDNDDDDNIYNSKAVPCS